MVCLRMFDASFGRRFFLKYLINKLNISNFNKLERQVLITYTYFSNREFSLTSTLLFIDKVLFLICIFDDKKQSFNPTVVSILLSQNESFIKNTLLLNSLVPETSFTMFRHNKFQYHFATSLQKCNY